MFTSLRSRLIAATIALASLPLAAPAWACGGFFCFTQPIDQSAERILYVQQVGKITVHIQISYKGDDKQFSWILPLQKIPTLGIGSDTVFQVLEQATAPLFQLNWQQGAKDCYGNYGCMEDAAAGGGGPPGASNGGGVTVLKTENVGPYETVVIQGDTGDDLYNWLNTNKYIQPAATKPLLDLYAKQKYVFLALKLQQDKSAGDLAPIVITMDEPSPCLPLRLTQLAAQPDMPIVAWVVGAKRAIPKNFLHVEINEATVDWLTNGGNYKSVVSKAVDQASGHAFTTEYAQPMDKFQSKFVMEAWAQGDFDGITDPGKFLQKMMEKGYPRTTQMQTLIKKFIPKPVEFAKVGDQEFYGCVQNSQPGESGPCKAYSDAVKAAKFDAKGFADALWSGVVKPLQDIQAQFDAAKYVTRLFTTVSPEEMTKDPIFAFNGELPAVERTRTAKATPICNDPKSTQATDVKLEFADGHVLTVKASKDNQGCYFPGSVAFDKSVGPIVEAGGQPAKKVQVLDETGPAVDVQPMSTADLVDAQLDAAKVGTPSLSAEFLKKLPKIDWDPYHVGAVPSGVAAGADAGSRVATDAGPSSPNTTATSSSCSANTQSAGRGWLLACAIAAGLVVFRRRKSV